MEKEKNLIELLYSSIAKDEICNYESLLDIVTKSNDKNNKLNISGLLLFHKGDFLQVLEGKKETVENLVNKIKEDTRHKNFHLIYKGEIDKRSFKNWGMNLISSNSADFIMPKQYDFLNNQRIFEIEPDNMFGVCKPLLIKIAKNLNEYRPLLKSF